MKKPVQRVAVSDHAVLRYLERVGGFDIHRLKMEIADAVQPAANLGATKVRIGEHDFILHPDATGAPVLVTVVPKNYESLIAPRNRAGE